MNVAPPLLMAKFHRPTTPRHLVARPALVARLNDGLAADRSGRAALVEFYAGEIAVLLQPDAYLYA